MSAVQFLYPADISFPRLVDEAYLTEFEAAQEAGIPCSVFNYDGLESGKLRILPGLVEGVPVIYRGWMLPPERYALLQAGIEAKGTTVVSTVEDYQGCHYLPGWYEQVADLTPKTMVFYGETGIAEAIEQAQWPAYFVKDFVKSLTTSRGSIAGDAAEVFAILALLDEYRGGLEGGICLREYENFQAGTEQRFFVYNGKAFGMDGSVPAIVDVIASRIKRPFYSVDIVLNRAGQHRLVELGDGQVSDIKHWPVEAFIKIFSPSI